MEKQRRPQHDIKKRFLISCFLIFLLISFAIGVTFAISIFAFQGRRENTIRTGNLTFSYTEESNGISLTDTVPTSDEVGKRMKGNDKESKYFDFSVSCKMSGNENIQYEVYAIEEDVDQKLDPQYIKIYLTDSTSDRALEGYTGQVPTYQELKNASSSNHAKRLYMGSFGSSGTQSFRLRMWVADSYTNAVSSKKFKIKVNVSASS